MTDDKMALLTLLEQRGEGEFVRDLLGFAAARLLEAEVEARTGAAKGERSAGKLVQRNGYRERTWETRAGSIDLAIPKLRKGTCFPSLPDPRRTAEKALSAVIQEPYVQGISTRPVDNLVQATGGTGIEVARKSCTAGMSGGFA